MMQHDYDELAIALERNAASHAHTANKARRYLQRLVGKPATTTLGGRTQEEFISAVRHALHSDKWAELAEFMGRWW